MKVIDIIHNDIANAYPEIHKTRLSTLFTFVHSGLKKQRVTVTYLGRDLTSLSNTNKKHDIKRADRLIGNLRLHQERHCYYEFMSETLVGHQKHPLVIVDWSPINGQEIFQVLRASIPMGGRALTLYEKVYPESELNSEAAHQDLLNKLALCLPADCCPIILSDAIFRTPWFEAIEAKGWYWVGRVRGNVTLSIDSNHWHNCRYFFEQATSKVQALGQLLYAKKALFPCHAALYKGKPTGRTTTKKRGGASQCTTVKYQQQKAKEPWLIIYNLPAHWKNQAVLSINLYKQRMQIEENFRDTKSSRVGISLEYANSRTAARFDNLLLIASLILFILWIVGYATSESGHMPAMQANTVTNKQVLSYIYLGREAVDDRRYYPDDTLVIWVLEQLHRLTVSVDDFA